MLTLYKVRAALNGYDWTIAETYVKEHAEELKAYWEKKYPSIWIVEEEQE
jgi:hypothetical protein